MTAILAPITDADLVAVGEFMHANLNSRIASEQWERALDVPWHVDAPNHGFLLRHEDEMVGAYVAYYSDREIDGTLQHFCNLGAWCVLDGFRAEGVRLLRSLLSQKGYHFTDLSPSGNVVPLNKRLKFHSLDTATALLPNLPRAARGCRISDDPATIERALGGADLAVYRDHRTTAGARHLVVTDGDGVCYVVWRRDRRKGMPLFASILHVSNPAVFARCCGAMSRHLLMRHGLPATLAELRVVGGRPPFSLLMSTSRPKMYKSPTLRADDIDYLYSELTCLAW